MIKTTQIAENGPALSRIVAGVMKWGAWGKQLGTRQMQQLMEKCVELGVTTFDHADIYGNYSTELEFGVALRLNPALRENIQLVTKCGIRLLTPNRPDHKIKSYDTSKAHIIRSAEQSLRNLHTTYLDLLLIHRPDPLLHPDEVAEAFTALKKDGKVLYFGVSNFISSQFEMLNSRVPLVTNQLEASILHIKPFHDGIFDLCLQHRIKPMAWSPLGGGAIFAKVKEKRIQEIWNTAENIAARRENVGIDQILIAWLLRHPSAILPVLGTANIDRIKAAVAALDIQLTREEWFELWQASAGSEVP